MYSAFRFSALEMHLLLLLMRAGRSWVRILSEYCRIFFQVDDLSVPGFIDPYRNFIFCFDSAPQKLMKVSAPVTTSVSRLGFCQHLFDTFCSLHPTHPISGVHHFGRPTLYTPFVYIVFHGGGEGGGGEEKEKKKKKKKKETRMTASVQKQDPNT